MWFSSKWTPKPKQDGDSPHWVLKRSLSRFEEGKNEDRTPTEVDIVESKAVEVVTGDWGGGDRNVLEDRARALLEEKVKRKAQMHLQGWSHN